MNGGDGLRSRSFSFTSLTVKCCRSIAASTSCTSASLAKLLLLAVQRMEFRFERELSCMQAAR